MTDSEALRLIFDRANALQIYWSFYGTAVGAVLAFFGTKHRECDIALVLTVAFLALAGANLLALRDVTRQRLVLQEIFTGPLGTPPECRTIECRTALSVRPATLEAVTTLHLISDVLVVAAIWLLVTVAK